MLRKLIKKYFFKNESIERLRTLLWSNTIENDLLALENVRTNGLPKAIAPDFIAVALTIENKEVKDAYLSFLKETCKLPLTTTQYRNPRKTRNLRISDYKQLEKITNVSSLLYAYYKRTGQGTREFLTYTDAAHSCRKEVLEAFIEQTIREAKNAPNNVIHLHLKGLTEREMTTLLNEEALKKGTLGSIFLDKCKIKKLPKILFQNTSIRRLDIERVSLTQFPTGIFQLTHLVKLRIADSTFNQLPKDWSALKELEALNFYGSKVKIDDFFFVTTLPKLKDLRLGNSILKNPYLLMTPKALPIKSGAAIWELTHLPVSTFMAYASAIASSSLVEKDKRYFFDLVRSISKFKELPTMSKLAMLKAMNIQYTAFREVVRKRLADYTEKHESGTLNKKSVLQVVGTTVLSKREIKTKLETLDIGYTSAYDEQVTHLLIGKSPKKSINFHNKDLQLITENQLQKFFSKNQPQYLEQAAQTNQTGLAENLSALLMNLDSANVMIALEMLKKGGVPPEMVEKLLVVQKTNTDKKIRATSKRLLNLYAPADWLPLIQDRQNFELIHEKVRENKLMEKLSKVGLKSSQYLAATLSLALFKVYGQGLRYIFYYLPKSSPWRAKGYQAIMKGTHCNFSTGMGYLNLRDRKPETIYIHNRRPQVSFPLDILEVVDKIESIDFHNCNFYELHKDICKFTDLKHLDCSCNDIDQLPKEIAQLTNLETLDLSNNSFKEFPMEVLGLKNLKKLDLRFRHDYENKGFYELEIPEEIKRKLVGCEILV